MWWKPLRKASTGGYPGGATGGNGPAAPACRAEKGTRHTTKLNRDWGSCSKSVHWPAALSSVPLCSAVFMPDHALRYQFAGHDVNEEICPQNRLQTAVERLPDAWQFLRVSLRYGEAEERGAWNRIEGSRRGNTGCDGAQESRGPSDCRLTALRMRSRPRPDPFAGNGRKGSTPAHHPRPCLESLWSSLDLSGLECSAGGRLMVPIGQQPEGVRTSPAHRSHRSRSANDAVLMQPRLWDATIPGFPNRCIARSFVGVHHLLSTTATP